MNVGSKREVIDVLCVGGERFLLQARCMVLGHSGYTTRSADWQNGLSLLGSVRFRLVILSVDLAQYEKGALNEAADPSTQIFEIRGLLTPRELLDEVGKRLRRK